MIYITGSSGYIGSRLINKINEVIHTGNPGNLTGVTIHPVITCDLKCGLDVLSYEPKSKIDVIYHLAAQAGIPESVEDPINDARQNILGTLRAIKLANEHNAKLIFTASAASLNPESPYGLSKKTAEEYIKMLCNDYVILRLSSIYGKKPVGVVDNFIRGDKCVIYGDGSAIRDFVHVDDIIEALMMANGWPKGTYDCGSGVGTRVIDLAEATGKEIIFEPERRGEIHESILENTTPNWNPKIDVINYIKQSV